MIQHPLIRPVLATLFVIPTLLLGSAASAEDAEEVEVNEGVTGIEEVIVSATRRETNLMETPLAVSSFSQEALEREGIKNMTDIGDLIPNMQIGVSPSDSGVSIAVRGIASNNFTELGDPTVGIHVDGMYTARPQGAMALLFDVERIDILRGPQGTLFGRNSTAGTVNIITSRPDFDEHASSFEFETGNDQLRAGRAWINIPVNEKLAFRASFIKEQKDTYLSQERDLYDFELDFDGDGLTDGPDDVPLDGIPNVDQRRNFDQDADEAYGSVDRWAGRLSMRFAPTDEIDWLLTYDQFQDYSPGAPFLKDCDKASGTFFACDHDQLDININTAGEMDMTIKNLRSQLIWEATDAMTVEYRVAYSEQTRSQLFDQDGGSYTDPDHPGYGFIKEGTIFGDPDNPNTLIIKDEQAFIDLGFEPRSRAPFEDLALETEYSNYDSWVHDIIVRSTTDSELQWLAGYFYLKEENEIKFNVESPFCCDFIRPLAQSFVQPERTVESQAVFAQFDYAVNDKLNLTAGYRHTWDKKQDKGGKNYLTTGYWTNGNLYGPDPANEFWYESWSFVGPDEDAYGFDVPFWADFYQSDDLTSEHGTLGSDFTNRVPSTDNTHDAKWDKGTWRLGFDYVVNDDLFVYGYVATGYKSGGFGDYVDTNGAATEGGETVPDYDPEEVTTYELGFKTALLDGTLNLLGNVFFNDYEDMQKSFWAIVGTDAVTGNDIGTWLTTNVAAAETMGVELEFDWRPYDGGRIFGWAAWLDAEIKDLPSGDGWFCFERAYLGLSECAAEVVNTDPDIPNTRPTNFSGNKLPWSPEWSVTITAEHNWYFDNGLRITPSVTMHWQDEMFFQDNNYDEGPFHSGQEAYTTFNAAVHLVDEANGWGAELYVYNLTDEETRVWGDQGPGYVKSSFAPPRAYGLKLRKWF